MSDAMRYCMCIGGNMNIVEIMKLICDTLDNAEIGNDRCVTKYDEQIGILVFEIKNKDGYWMSYQVSINGPVAVDQTKTRVPANWKRE